MELAAIRGNVEPAEPRGSDELVETSDSVEIADMRQSS